MNFPGHPGPSDILILTNGPGELATWVRPMVRALRDLLGPGPRLSVVLSPCPHATGAEMGIARGYPEVDRVLPASAFFNFLITGKTPESWDWHPQGVILFLGGDQAFPVLLGKRLGYRTVVYAEQRGRWAAWIDQFAASNDRVGVAAKYRHKLAVVGDLTGEVGAPQPLASPGLEALPKLDADGELIGLLPGSKSAKLTQGVPLCLAAAGHLHRLRPHDRFVVPLAPSLDPVRLAAYADPSLNPYTQVFPGGAAELVIPTKGLPFLRTVAGAEVVLWPRFPSYNLLKLCRICLTTVGANTAELGVLGIPMVVLLPTQQLDAMRSWDGLPGILARLPGVGSVFARVINGVALQRLGRLAWPNIWAGHEIVPELVGPLDPATVAQVVVDYLSQPERLQVMVKELQRVSPAPGAAAKLATLVAFQLVR